MNDDQQQKQMEHPSSDWLTQYIEQPAAMEFSSVREHLAHCSDCRDRVQRLQTVVDQLSMGMSTVEKSIESSVDEVTLARYLAGSLTESERADIQSRLQGEPNLLKAALHMRSQMTDAQLNAFSKSEKTETIKRSNTKWLQAIKGFCIRSTNLKNPVWVTAMLVVGLAFVLQWPQSINEHANTVSLPTLVQYQDEAGIKWHAQSKQPGIGFFRQSIVEEYGGLEVRFVAINTLSIRWPKLQDVESYRLVLSKQEGGTMTTLVDTSLSENHYQWSSNKIQAGKRYQWDLLGTDTSGREFAATGGFVIGQQPSKKFDTDTGDTR